MNLQASSYRGSFQTVDKVSFYFVYSPFKVCSHEIGVCPAWLENACHVEGSLSARHPVATTA